MKKLYLLIILVFLLLGIGLWGLYEEGIFKADQDIVDDNYRNYYEIFVRSFYDSDNDGIGDFNGVAKKLDYIRDTGFNGIWLMPIMPSTTYHKYDVTDYEAVSDEYGTMEDFENLVKKCHKNKIRIIIDMVFNHTSSKHEWFVKATDYLRTIGDGEIDESKCPYAGYYHFSKKKESDAWYNVKGTNWYYEGSFWSEMPDLDVSNENVKKEFEKISDFWIKKGVDGFRMDAALHYDDKNQEINKKTLSDIYEYCRKQNPDFYMVSEVWAGKSVIASYYESKTPSMFNFPDSSTEGVIVKAARGKYDALKLIKSFAEDEKVYGEVYKDYIDAPFLTNHDQVRVANNLMCNEDDLKMAAGILMTMGGSPFVYYGEEVGMKSFGQNDENKRLPMIWSDKDTKGICNPPENAEKNAKQSFPSVKEQEENVNSIWNYYKRALFMRNTNPEIARGKFEVCEELSDKDLAVAFKEWNGKKVAICYNLSDKAKILDISSQKFANMKMKFSLTLNFEDVVDMSDKSITLPKQSIIILR